MKSVRSILFGMALTMCATVAAGAQGTAGTPMNINIKSQPLSAALSEWAAQTGLQFNSASGDVTDDITAPAVKGRLTPQAALERLLADTGLIYQFVDEQSVFIRAPEKAAKVEKVPPERSGSAHGPNAGTTAREQDRTRDASDSRIEDVLVVGTHIRGAKNNTAPVYTIERAEIDASGLLTTDQLIRSLPQNFGGGISSTTLGGPFRTGGEDAAQNIGLGTGTNLRGLGNDSTLVLLNGRRLAPIGFGHAVDVSMIPLDAIERVQILTDGASAIYGSDAVGGVVNIILRNNFEGAQTSVGYGAVTEGEHSSVQASQLLGSEWDSGSLLFSYYYHDQSRLRASDRSASRTMPEPTDLLGPETRHTALLSVSQSVAEGVKVFGDAIYSARDTSLQANFGAPGRVDIEVVNYGGTAGATLAFARNWQGEMAMTYNRSETSHDSPFVAGADTLATQADVAMIEAKADGEVLRLPGERALKVALGGQLRQETYDSDGATQRTLGVKKRKVRVGYAELLVPILGSSDELGQRLEFSVAARHEDYDEFGSVTNPKLGISWVVAPGWNLRATAGRSFHAPLLFELDEHSFSPVLVRNPVDPANPSGRTPTIIRLGNNSDLQAEKSTDWTAGIDVEPASVPGLNLALSYFHADYDERISVPIPGVFNDAFLLAALDAPVVTRDPSIDLVQQLFAAPNVHNPNNFAPADIGAIVDNRLTNIARRQQSGLDFDASYRAETSFGHLNGRLSMTYLLRMRERVTPVSVMVDALNDVYLPIDFRVRAGLGWANGPFEVAGWLSYIDDYADRRVAPPTSGPPLRQSVASWTTFDLSMAYDSGRRDDNWLLDGLRVALSVQNVFDRDPPFVSGPFGLNFDTANANALGRFASIQIRKAW